MASASSADIRHPPPSAQNQRQDAESEHPVHALTFSYGHLSHSASVHAEQGSTLAPHPSQVPPFTGIRTDLPHTGHTSQHFLVMRGTSRICMKGGQ